MKQLFVGVLFVSSIQVNADVFSDYQQVGTEALQIAKSTSPNVEEFVIRTQNLVQLGYQIMELHQVKYTECTEQYSQLKAMDSKISAMSYEEMDEQLHDGHGLVAAPKSCYRGRSMVVHPYQLFALAKEGKIQTQLEVVEHELEEVIHRAEIIKKDLGL